MSEISSKKAVIVGGGTGIGQAIAKSLDDAGAHVAIGGRREGPLRDTANGTNIEIHSVDVACRESTDRFFSWAQGTLGQIDIMVNAAGVNVKTRSMAEMTPEQWDQIMAINATGVYNCMHAVLPAMRQRRSGTIVNISSVAGKRAIALGGIAYSASKFAMSALGTCVANEVADEGVRITNVYPGEVNTPILENRPTPVTEEHKQRIVQPDSVAQLIRAILELPDAVHVPEVVIKPLTQEWF